MEVTTKYNGTVSQSRYENGGEIVQPLKQIGTTNSTGLTVSFLPDKKIFKDVKFNHSIIEERVKETSFLYKGLKIIFKNEINDEEKIFESKTGIIEYVEFINEGKTKLHDTIYFEGKNNGIEVEVALQYTTGVSETIVSFANSVKTKEGGSHETAFKSCITEVINSCARK
jgi:topoisomerase-4 subunit B